MVRYIAGLFGIIIFLFLEACSGGVNKTSHTPSSPAAVIPAKSPVRTQRVWVGAEVLIDRQLNLLQGKRVALVAHPASVVFGGKTHLVDTLIKAGIHVQKVFAPEHGFRGQAEAGELFSNTKDHQTGLPVISLYDKNFKPKSADLTDVDVVVFDLQDVGSRFYTYISTLSYVMQACAENKKTLIVLDRPNPNADYVDGPVMEKKHTSFVGLHEVPIVYGMTIGEYAKMINDEGWNPIKADLKVIPLQNYRHNLPWEETGLPWIPPSPNLPTVQSARIYPLLCWYEATVVSVGRGTSLPFEVVGFPFHQGAEKQYKKDSILREKTTLKIEGLEAEAIQFIPKSIVGKSLHPPYQNQVCWGFKIMALPQDPNLRFRAGTALLQNMYREYNGYFSNRDRTPPTPFFNPPGYFPRLAGNASIEKMLREEQKTENICASWQNEVLAFKKIRKKYLLYP